jgi:hypothetical protein
MSTAAPSAVLGTSTGSLDRNPVSARTAIGTSSVPWYLWTGAVAVTSATIGGAWDVSWHRTIGRDTFWTPAHMLIYLCGVLAAIVGMFLVAKSTFGSDAETRASSVKVLGLRAPLGVFLAGWGGVAMMTSAPFDNWWHNAYGLDVKIVSPPHTLLILGIRAVGIGMLFLVLAQMNRAGAQLEQVGGAAAEAYAPDAALFRQLRWIFLYIGGLTVGGQMFFLQEYTLDIKLHSVETYIALAIAVPVVLAMFSEATRYPWAATVTAAVYMVFIMGEILILPLFPAQPKLGPVFNPVTHMIPAQFPVLLVLPALALDLFWSRTREWARWQVALLSGVIFVAVVAVVEWPFANFLMSKASQNRFFGTTYFSFDARPTALMRRRIFVHPTYGAVLWWGLLRASVYGAISTWLGLGFGRWMRGVQR